MVEMNQKSWRNRRMEQDRKTHKNEDGVKIFLAKGENMR